MRLMYLKYIFFVSFILVILAVPVTLVVITNSPMYIFARDIFALTNSPPIIGFISNMGAFVWCSALSVILFTIFSMSSTDSISKKRFLYFSALITGYLFIDDFFMVHDFWFKRIGLDSIHAYTGIGVLFIVYISLFFRPIIESNYSLFIASFCFLFISLALDIGENFGFWKDNDWKWYYLFEDGSKWIGICFWAAYFFSTSRRILVANFADQLKRDDPSKQKTTV